MNTFNTLQELFASWDPMGFIADGAANDEYDMEAADISLKFKREMSEDELADLIYAVFVDRIGLNPKGFKEDCKNIAPLARTILLMYLAKFGY